MEPFGISPIQNEAQLRLALEHIHFACHALCMQTLHTYLPVAGNIGIFCHDETEYMRLTKIKETITDPSIKVYGKYFKLYNPIIVPAKETIPARTYTYLYIRKPDSNKPHIGDLDFYIEPKAFTELKQYVSGGSVFGARLLPNRPDLDLIELYDPNIDALGYIGDKLWK